MNKYLFKNIGWLQVTLFILSSSSAQKVDISGICASVQTSCGDCILAHFKCSWCLDQHHLNTSAPHRCRTLEEHKVDCSNIINPASSVRLIKNVNFPTVADQTTTNIEEVIQLKPQEQNIKLRIGEPYKSNLTFKKLIDSPLDLYYTMDLSLSMSDDLEFLKELGVSLIDDIRTNVTNNTAVGFGSFVDKVLLPYATDEPSVIKTLCNNSMACEPTFGFRHQLPITGNGTLFKNSVQDTVISTNIDTPEGGFDALMQIAVCNDIIGWRKGALRVILFTTDAISHSAMDGKLGGILEVNDMRCHLEREEKGNYIYYKSKEQDYPSIGQLKEVFNQNKIQSIFAVTSKVYDIYKNFPRVLPSFVGILDKDSSNILPIISNAYDQIKTHLELIASSVPDSLQMTYRTLCPRSEAWKENSLECNNIFVGDEIVFQFELLAKNCPTDAKRTDKIEFSSSSIADVATFNIGYHCECGCENTPIINSTFCNYDGNLQCGICNCSNGKSGSHCLCEAGATALELQRNCTDSKGLIPDKVCNNHGICECGKCKCNTGYFGNYCQCKATDCATDEKEELCGGATQGNCKNCYGDGKCVCNIKDGWYLNNASGLCDCNDLKCKETAQEEVCSGKGKCDCDTCVCANNSLYWEGQYCNVCVHPACNKLVGQCDDQQLGECAECAYSNVATEACKDKCQDLGINFKILSSLPSCSQCNAVPSGENCNECDNLNEEVFSSIDCGRTRAIDKCVISFKIGWDKNQRNYVIFVKSRNSVIDCPQAIQPIYIISPVVGFILIIGIIAIVVSKVAKTKWDKKQYEKFMAEVEKSRWESGANPIHREATQRYVNPNFVGFNED